MNTRLLHRVFLSISAATALLTATSCESIDDERIPPVSVRIDLSNIGLWHTYGVPGALDHREFIRNATPPVPIDFPYTALTYTGFGGILLVGDISGAPVAYDLACPVECKADIRIRVDAAASDAYCPVCGSHYDIFSNRGYPTSGPAAKDRYGLQVYHVTPKDDGYIIER
ncbi:MAG: hypothetical protein NC117_01515 [Pseudoflavonifractor sp.]|nr:hypothetical protein [Pseudoflavonifractor sp.]